MSGCPKTDMGLQMNVEGPSCSSCKSGTFHLSQENKDGCLSCFCMGVTQQCSSSTYYRDLVRPESHCSELMIKDSCHVLNFKDTFKPHRNKLIASLHWIKQQSSSR